MAELDVGTAILSVSTPGTAFLPNPARRGRARSRPQRLHRRRRCRPARSIRVFRHRSAAAHRRVGRGSRPCTRRTSCRRRCAVGEQRRHLSRRGRPGRTVRRPQRPLGGGLHPPRRTAGTQGSRVSCRSRWTSCSTPPVPHTCWCATVFEPAIPTSEFILSHAGGFVPYASHRMAVAITADTGRSWADVLDDFAGFYFDTALSSSAAALPTLLAFAKPGSHHVRFRFPVCPDRGREAVRGRAGDLSRDSMPAPAPPSSAPTRWRCSPGSALRRNPFRSPGAAHPPHRQPLSATRRRPADEYRARVRPTAHG